MQTKRRLAQVPTVSRVDLMTLTREAARVELAAEPEFDRTIVNRDVRTAADDLVSLMGLPVRD